MGVIDRPACVFNLGLAGSRPWTRRYGASFGRATPALAAGAGSRLDGLRLARVPPVGSRLATPGSRNPLPPIWPAPCAPAPVRSGRICHMRPFTSTITLDEARARLLAAVAPIDRARARRARRGARPRARADVVAPFDVPPFDRSAMDGYAVRAADTAGATRAAAQGAALSRPRLHRGAVSRRARSRATASRSRPARRSPAAPTRW